MNKHEAASVIALIAAAFPTWAASRETVAVYVEGILDLGYEPTRAAVRRLLYSEDRWPTIAAIRREVAHATGVLAPTAAQAWAEVRSEAERVGRTGRPQWSHPTVAESVRAIGWFDLVSSSNTETIRAQFLRIHDDTQRRHDRLMLTEPGNIPTHAIKRSDEAIAELVE